jgi:hypothetical protein
MNGHGPSPFEGRALHGRLRVTDNADRTWHHHASTPAIPEPRFALTAAAKPDQKSIKEPAMSKPTIEQTRMGTEAIAFCIARTLIERDPSLKAPMRANLRKMWELLEEREDHGAADMVDTMIKALNDPAFFKP